MERVPKEEKNAIRNYKQQELFLGKHDLNPPFSDPDPKIKSPSPGFIREQLIAGCYHQTKEKEEEIISKLKTAIAEATEARRLFLARVGGDSKPDDGHKLRIDIYTALVNDPTTWLRAK